MGRGAWQATVHRVSKSQTLLKQLSTHACRYNIYRYYVCIYVIHWLVWSPWTARRSNWSILKEIRPEYFWKDWCWGWSSNTMATWCKEPTHWKIHWCWDRFRARGEGATEDEMVGWHHWFNGHESEQTPGDGEGQGSLASCSSWGCKESDMTLWLKNYVCVYSGENLQNNYDKWKWKSLSCVSLFATPWTIQSMEFSRPQY